MPVHEHLVSMNGKNRAGMLTGAIIAILAIPLIILVRERIESHLWRYIIAVGISGGLFLIVQVTNRIKDHKSRNRIPKDNV